MVDVRVAAGAREQIPGKSYRTGPPRAMREGRSAHPASARELGAEAPAEVRAADRFEPGGV